MKTSRSFSRGDAHEARDAVVRAAAQDHQMTALVQQLQLRLLLLHHERAGGVGQQLQPLLPGLAANLRRRAADAVDELLVLDGVHVVGGADALFVLELLEGDEVVLGSERPDGKPVAVFLHHLLVHGSGAMHAHAETGRRNPLGVLEVDLDHFHESLLVSTTWCGMFADRRRIFNPAPPLHAYGSRVEGVRLRPGKRPRFRGMKLPCTRRVILIMVKPVRQRFR